MTNAERIREVLKSQTAGSLLTDSPDLSYDAIDAAMLLVLVARGEIITITRHRLQLILEELEEKEKR